MPAQDAQARWKTGTSGKPEVEIYFAHFNGDSGRVDISAEDARRIAEVIVKGPPPPETTSNRGT
jgi:hypothetical protein